MKVAVTGASGFVGSYVLAELERLNIEIVATTRTSVTRDYSESTSIRWVNLDIA